MLILPPRTSWLYTWALSVHERKRYMVTLLFLVMIGALWFKYAYEPLERAHDRLSLTAPHEERELHTLQEKIAALKSHNSSSEHKKEITSEYIFAALDAAGLPLEQCMFQEKECTIFARGSMEQILLFLEQIIVHTSLLQLRLTSVGAHLFSLQITMHI